MSTNCTVWIKNDDNTYDGVYVHYDGYYEGVGRTLVENYYNPEKVRALIDLGSISYIAPKVAPDELDKLNFDNPEQKDVTLAYHRDRGEDYYMYHCVTLEDAKEVGKQYSSEYMYVFDRGEWKNGYTMELIKYCI